MGLVKVTAKIGMGEDSLRDVEFLVDAGSFYSFVTPEMGEDLGISFPVTSRVVTADNRTVEVGVGIGYLRLDDREGGIIVAEMDVPMPLLGASAMEALGLKVDPVTEKLEHSLPFGPAALPAAFNAPVPAVHNFVGGW